MSASTLNATTTKVKEMNFDYANADFIAWIFYSRLPMLESRDGNASTV